MNTPVKITFPDQLPVSRRREDIREALAKHPVVIVCGDTGSGKTTQLPKIALEMGRGVEGRRIGCTQPRRIAATSVAKRVADELQVSLGKEVGYQIRFEDRTDKKTTAVKFMTDGVLLAETRNDPNLRQYDTLIIDEAHERSLNIDFILGYLHRTLERRTDLKVVISSATLDAGSFSDFFGGAPVIEVEGRTFPVEDQFQPPLDDREPVAEQVARAVEDLAELDPLGDTLVFLPGEREIRDTADLLDGRNYAGAMVLPLFARQAGKEQQAVFKPSPSRRRIILATNVAETSLTIPDIRFVIDSGLARVSRHDPGSGIQRLQIEEISKASARQRRGRCGRVSEGVCVRLYDEDNFADRDEYTDPEILRSNLAGVVLQMEHLGLGDPLEFPFVDPPQPKRVSQAYRVLDEIGAVQQKGRHVELTQCGRALARMPVDPRIGKILVAAKEEGCLLEALIVASALTVQDPRERPKEKQQAADEKHAKFRDKRSDFTGWLRLWYAIQEERRGSTNRLRRFCQKNFVNFRRVQEWLNLHRELRDSIRSMKWELPAKDKWLTDPEDTYSEPLHRAILSAIPSQIGMHQGKKMGYKGARNSVFFLFPGSGIFGSAPAWVMAFEMVETAKLYARNAAMFDPGWFEKVAPHLCRYRYSNPQWVKDQGAVYGEERVMAFGLPVVEKRRIHYGRIDRAVARNVFILEALVNQNTRAPMTALAQNRETALAAERLEHKMRRLGGLMHPEAIVAFYEDRIPPDICTQKDFEKWVVAKSGGFIDFSLEECLLPQQEPIQVEEYPDTILSSDGETEFALVYLHNPSDPGDGISVEIPLVELPHLPDWFGEWLVPGWLEEKVSALLRCLRKDTRTLLPANREVVDAFLDSWAGYDPACSLIEAIIDFLENGYGMTISLASFELERLPEHLSIRYVILNDKRKQIAEGKDLSALQTELSGQVKARFQSVSRGKFQQQRIGSWSFGDLPEEVELDRHTVGYPRLYDGGQELPSMRLWPSASCAEVQHRLGVAKLYEVTHQEMIKRLLSELFRSTPVAQSSLPVKTKKTAPSKSSNFGSMAAAFGEVETKEKSTPPSKTAAPAKAKPDTMSFLTADEAWLLSKLGLEPERNRDDLLKRIISDELGTPITRAEWEEKAALLDTILFERASGICSKVSKILEVAGRVGALLDSREAGYEDSIQDARDHFARLLSPGWILSSDLTILAVHFQGLEMRLTRMLGAPPIKDFQKVERYWDESASIWQEELQCECGQCPEALVQSEQLKEDFALRLHLFAPEIKARMK
ncbi:MAG: ATP-dependent RNA helicase HrpA [Verrucomicrobiota bacterium]